MAREYTFTGRFEITTNCPDVDKIAVILNETARQFADIMDFRSEADGSKSKGYMWIANELEIIIPVNDTQNNLYDLEESEADVEDD
jgi:hypothetical protein